MLISSSHKLLLDLAAARLVLLDLLARSKAHTGRVLGGRRCVRHSLLDLSRHHHEGRLNVSGVLGRGFQELNAQALSELLGSVRRNYTLGCEIALVTDQELVHVLTGISVNLMQPLLDVVERLLIRDIVHNDDAVGATVVAARDGTETFLTSRVPNLELDGLAVELDRSDFEVDTNGRDVTFRVGVVSETQEKTRLADARVTDEEELEEVIVFWVHGDEEFSLMIDCSTSMKRVSNRSGSDRVPRSRHVVDSRYPPVPIDCDPSNEPTELERWIKIANANAEERRGDDTSEPHIGGRELGWRGHLTFGTGRRFGRRFFFWLCGEEKR